VPSIESRDTRDFTAKTLADKFGRPYPDASMMAGH
jgi:hypothetical protein